MTFIYDDDAVTVRSALPDNEVCFQYEEAIDWAYYFSASHQVGDTGPWVAKFSYAAGADEDEIVFSSRQV